MTRLAADLGPQRTVELSAGTVVYRDLGDGPPVVLLGAFLTDSVYWRNVVPKLAAEGYRCVVPDFPMGAHRIPMKADADLSARGLANLLAEFIRALDLHEPVVVGNDTGGGITQIMAAEHPGVAGPLVLASCDVYDYFPPKLFRYLAFSARLPGAGAVLAQTLRVKRLRRLPITFGWVSKRIPDDAIDHYGEAILTDKDVRRDAVKLLRGYDPALLTDCAGRLRDHPHPILILWAAEDRILPRELAERLHRSLPQSRFALLEDSLTLIPEDQPDGLVREVVAFLAAGA